MGVTKLAAVFYFVGVACVAAGAGFFDWRAAPIVVGVGLVVPVLLLKESE